MKIYIAGPMSGFDEFNFPAFDRAAWDLQVLGHTPLNPAQMDRDVGFDPNRDEVTIEFLQAAMRRDVDAILDHADAILMLPGWKGSTGAKAEYWLARWKHIPIYIDIKDVPYECS